MILDVIRREHSRRSFQAVVPRPYGAAVGENMYFGTAGSHARRWRKRPVSTHVDRARRNGAAALQSSLGPAAPPRPVHVVAPARTRGVPSSLDVGGAPSGRLCRDTRGPVAPTPVPSGTGRIGGGCTRSDHDVGTSARRHGRQRAAADVDTHSLAWLLEQAARKKRHGTLRARAVRDGERGLIGWYLYYVRAGWTGEVVQIAARNGWFGRVLQRFLGDAWRHGAVAVRGVSIRVMFRSCRTNTAGCDRKAHATWSIPATPKSWRPSNKGTPCSAASKASGGCGSRVDKEACSLSQG